MAQRQIQDVCCMGAKALGRILAQLGDPRGPFLALIFSHLSQKVVPKVLELEVMAKSDRQDWRENVLVSPMAVDACGQGRWGWAATYFMCFFLFLQAWAVFKGKFKEGDKAEPATWKTRLRCALNKSPDFEEVTDRSQLDISEPYKVYRIVPEEEQKCNYPLQVFSPAEAARPAGPAREPGSGVGSLGEWF